jgi:hypothetical protein
MSAARQDIPKAFSNNRRSRKKRGEGVEGQKRICNYLIRPSVPSIFSFDDAKNIMNNFEI